MPFDRRRPREPHFGPPNEAQAATGDVEDRAAITALAPESSPGSPPSWLKIGAVVLCAFGVLAAAPPFVEGADSNCKAVELRALTIGTAHIPRSTVLADIVVENFRRSLATGEVATAIARRRFPSLPAPLSCAGMFWRSYLDPAPLQFVASPRQ
ncbi:MULTISPECIES: hypothetical protein [Roseomonadaceae]|uniref:Cell wall hydrolase SleB domain-containing protein n=1 Tax=Falsiroseomonas oleicola TaxID=2801474 RepID=A0ABS6HAT2_9PROT|nr:hypothetical protein [Roseomonas oleicola]MBU8545793.1 hypothetical protein [Roseomonas oleicola]